jgi:hypothetical protein
MEKYMKEQSGYHLRPGHMMYTKDGFRLIAREKNPRNIRKKPGETAYHEAEHAVIEPHHVKKVSIVPGPGYLGITEMTSMSAVVALGPKSRGRGGTGWDEHIAEQIGSSGAESAARAILSGLEDEIEEVAYALEEKKTLSGSELIEVMRSVDEGRDYEVFVKTPDGKEEVFTQQTARGVEFVPFELPMAA